jgi:hypothetical protein
MGLGRSVSALPLASIHRSAWKFYSPTFATRIVHKRPLRATRMALRATTSHVGGSIILWWCMKMQGNAYATLAICYVQHPTKPYPFCKQETLRHRSGAASVPARVTWFSIVRRRIVNTATVVFWVSVPLLGMVLILPWLRIAWLHLALAVPTTASAAALLVLTYAPGYVSPVSLSVNGERVVYVLVLVFTLFPFAASLY